jgi:hypothetical protein
VYQVGESFRVHEPVLNGNMNQLFRCLTEVVVDDAPDPPVVRDNLFDGGPIGWLILGGLANRRIDAELEQFVELGMKRLNAQGLAADQVPIECLEMPKVKDEPMAFRHGPGIDGLRAQQREQLIRAGSRGFHALAKDSRKCWRSRHAFLRPPLG